MRKSLSTPFCSIAVAIACTCASLAPASPAFGESATNGVYGGYVGSSAWFASMRASAANQEALRSLRGKSGTGRLPAGYVECAGRIVFPGGNPFPKGRLPDLRIRCRTAQVDGVERAPFVNDDGSFYTVFKRGGTYDLYWMGYFGGLEKFASLYVAPTGPVQRTFVVKYRIGGTSPREQTLSARRDEPTPAPSSESTPRNDPANGTKPMPALTAVEANSFDLAEFPATPTTFEEQLVKDAIQSATTPQFKAEAHEKLARYYERKGSSARAQAERRKAEYWRAGAR